MRNLWIFLTKYNAFFLFIIFFIAGLILTIRNNVYQRSTVFSSTNTWVGTTYERINVIKRYLNLGEVNDRLVAENAQLRTQLLKLTDPNDTKIQKVNDSVYQQQYTLLSAKIIKNSISQKKNILTINKGSNDGIVRDMAVISANTGVVGFIQDVTPHFSTIRSLLNSETAISVVLKKQHVFGSLVWGDNNFDFQKAYVKEIPNHIPVKIGDTIITSGSGGFPKGIEVGSVIKTGVVTGDSFMTLAVKLANNFSTLQYVYVIKDKYANEAQILQTTNTKP
jgi:rod shape-determining protein MreC